MRILNESLELTSLCQLKPHPRNPRVGNVSAIEESIAVNGFFGAIVAQRSTGYILVGNHRFLAAQQAGAEQVPVLWVDVNDATASRILLVDNRSSDLGRNDTTLLAELLQELAADEIGLTGTGFAQADIDRLLGELEPSAPTEAPAPTPAFQILIDCDSEAQQTEWLQRLADEGLRCRALL